MAKYTAKLTNGKTITLEGDEQPSDADFEEAAQGAGVTLLPAQPQLTVMPHAMTIQQDTTGPVKRAIDTAMYEASGVPGMLAGGVKNIVGGVNSVLGLVHAPQIPLDTEAANMDQRLGDAGMTAASFIPAGYGATKGVEAAAPIATRALHAVAPVVGGVAGASEGYRQHGLLGAVEGGVLGTAGGGFLGRVMRNGGKLRGLFNAAEAAPKANVAEEAAAALREATRVNEAVTPQDVQTYSRGRSQAPPVQESMRSQGESLLSPEARAHAANLGTEGPPMRPVSAHGIGTVPLHDVVGSPDKLRDIASMFAPEGGFSPARMNNVPEGARLTGADFRPRTLAEAYSLIGEQPPVAGPTALDVQRPHLGAEPPLAAPRPPSPNAGGRLVTQPVPQRVPAPAPTGDVMAPEVRQPAVTMSPRAEAAARMAARPEAQSLENSMRMRAQRDAYNRFDPQLEVVEPNAGVPQEQPSAAAVEALTKNLTTPEPPAPVKTKSAPKKTTVSKLPMEQRYEQLSAKRIRTPDEELEFQNLDRTMRATGARNRGKSYATKGK